MTNKFKQLIQIKPLSINIAWRGRRFKTPEYKQYRRDMGFLLDKGRVRGDVSVDLVFYLPPKSYKLSDIDNFIKPLFDCLVDKGIIDDDRKILQLTARKVLSDNYSFQIVVKKL